jgi:hypothetical protein
LKLIFMITLGLLVCASSGFSAENSKSTRAPASSTKEATLLCVSASGLFYALHATQDKISMKIVSKTGKSSFAKNLKVGVAVDSTTFREENGFFFPLSNDGKSGVSVVLMDQGPDGNGEFKELKAATPKAVAALDDWRLFVRSAISYNDAKGEVKESITGGSICTLPEQN